MVKFLENQLRILGGFCLILLQIDALNFHVQNVHHLVQTVTEASQAIVNLNQSKMARSSTQVQRLQKEASEWMRLTHSLISAANEVVIDPGMIDTQNVFSIVYHSEQYKKFFIELIIILKLYYYFLITRWARAGRFNCKAVAWMVYQTAGAYIHHRQL